MLIVGGLHNAYRLLSLHFLVLNSCLVFRFLISVAGSVTLADVEFLEAGEAFS